MNSSEWSLSYSKQDSNITKLLSIVQTVDGEISLDLSQVEDESRSTLDAPIYWNAPKSFTGNKVTSYGGKISYSLIIRVPNNQNLYAHIKPDVVLVGENLKLAHSSNIQPSDDTDFTNTIDLLEGNFNHFISHFKASRADLMQVLSNLTEIQIRYF